MGITNSQLTEDYGRYAGLWASMFWLGVVDMLTAIIGETSLCWGKC